MDILTDIFNSAGLNKTLLVRQSVYESWAKQFPCDKSIGFHVVTQGELFIRSKNLKSPIQLKRGDIAFMRRGFSHELATDLKAKAQLDLPEQKNRDVKAKALATFVSGVYQFRTEPIHPLFKELPETLVLRFEDIAPHDPLHPAMQLLSAELDQHGLGSESVTRSLLDILFNYILRNWLNQAAAKTSAWAVAMRDPQLSRALQSIHSDPSQEWTVDELATVAGLSRAAFAQKFKRVTGDTPAHYLTRVRIQRAMEMLRTSDQPIEHVAEVVGYNDSFVFSKAFKRVNGVSPRDYRKEMREAASS